MGQSVTATELGPVNHVFIFTHVVCQCFVPNLLEQKEREPESLLAV